MAWMMRVIKKGAFPEDVILNLQAKFKKTSEGVVDVANAARDHMRKTIKDNKRRGAGSGRLERAIQTHVETATGTVTIVGVGLIELLDIYAPYWYLLNYGGMVSPQARAVPGYFGNNRPPLPGLRGWLGHESFTYTPLEASADRGGTFFMNVETPITPVHYIEKAIAWARTITKVHWYNWTQETKIHTKTQVLTV